MTVFALLIKAAIKGQGDLINKKDLWLGFQATSDTMRSGFSNESGNDRKFSTVIFLFQNMNKLIKGTMTTVFSLAAFVVVALIALSIVSRSGSSHGLKQGKLLPCKHTQNCVCTEAFDNKNAEPLTIQVTTTDVAWTQLKNAVISTGGTIESEEDGYLWATYTTPVFRFIDDFEARLDKTENVIHLRSASRVGHGDLGANKKRVEKIVAQYQAGN